MNRRGAALLGLLAVVLLAGCAGFGTVTDEAGLHADPPATYHWDSDANATIEIVDGEYIAVYRLENQSSLRLHRQTRYGDDRPVPVRAAQFRYENGTVVNASAMEFEETRSAVHVELPAENGQFAYTGSHRTRNFGTQAYVTGDYEVILPPGYRADNIILGTIRPGGYDHTIVDDQVHIRWDDFTAGSLVVRYYLERDVYLFGGLIIVVSVAGAIGIGYVYRQIQRLKRRRQEMGLDIDIEDDRDRPPPGMG